MEHQRGRHQHEDRCHIVTQGRNGHRSVIEGFEEEHPVQSQQQPAEQQFGGLLPQDLPMEGDVLSLHEYHHGQAPQGRPQESQGDRAQGNVPAHQPDGPEDHQRKQHASFGRKKREFHTQRPSFTTDFPYFFIIA